MREERQAAIREILADQVVTTQHDLLDALQQRDMTVDQSTLSRDLSELQIRKVAGRYQAPTPGNGEAATPDSRSVMHAAVCGFVSCGPNLIVVRTVVGQAQPVALFIDGQEDNAIVATLAGDDTIFVATKNQKTHAVALRRLEAWFGDKRER